VPAGAGRVQLARRPLVLPPGRRQRQGALRQQPHRLAQQLLAAASAPEQRHAGNAQLIGEVLHVQPPALVDPPGSERDRPVRAPLRGEQAAQLGHGRAVIRGSDAGRCDRRGHGSLLMPVGQRWIIFQKRCSCSPLTLGRLWADGITGSA
jgi:hypothetical protein